MAAIITFRVKESPEKMEADILKAIRKQLGGALKGAAPGIKKRLQTVCDNLIRNTPEYSSLLSGELLAELGIPDVARRLGQVLTAIKRGVEVKSTPIAIRGNRLSGSMNITILKSDFEYILNLPASSYMSNQYLIPWLRWLIIEGDRILVITHEIYYNLSPSARARSRSGMALMRPGGGWALQPAEYRGTEDNNFITRAFNIASIEQLVAGIIRDEVQARLL